MLYTKSLQELSHNVRNVTLSNVPFVATSIGAIHLCSKAVKSILNDIYFTNWNTRDVGLNHLCYSNFGGSGFNEVACVVESFVLFVDIIKAD